MTIKHLGIDFGPLFLSPRVGKKEVKCPSTFIISLDAPYDETYGGKQMFVQVLYLD